MAGFNSFDTEIITTRGPSSSGKHHQNHLHHHHHLHSNHHHHPPGHSHRPHASSSSVAAAASGQPSSAFPSFHRDDSNNRTGHSNNGQTYTWHRRTKESSNYFNGSGSDLADGDMDETTTKETVQGMCCVAIGTLLICTVGAAVKQHNGSVLQLMEGRYIVQFIIAILWWKTSRPQPHYSWAGDGSNRGMIWIRGAIYFLLIFAWWRALELIPIGDCEAILFCSPLLTVFFARVLFNEPLPKLVGLTTIMTVAGVILICQPAAFFGNESSYFPITMEGLIFIAVACLSWTAVSLLLRTAQTAHWLQIELVSSFQAVFMWTPLLMLVTKFTGFSTLGGGDWDLSAHSLLLMLVIGIMGFAGLCFTVVGYQRGHATKVAWMEYLDLVFAFCFQCFVFGEMPNQWEIAGAALLFATCFISVAEETISWRKLTKSYRAGLDEIHKPLLS